MGWIVNGAKIAPNIISSSRRPRRDYRQVLKIYDRPDFPFSSSLCRKKPQRKNRFKSNTNNIYPPPPTALTATGSSAWPYYHLDNRHKEPGLEDAGILMAHEGVSSHREMAKPRAVKHLTFSPHTHHCIHTTMVGALTGIQFDLDSLIKASSPTALIFFLMYRLSQRWY
ncbi:hypothetical protein ElyMa_000490600 [Elysia marginata]|uniref:Uncharacterized protein n=1 Tax=Elysia marginata TaxID=1093978 RepID=A0AAV4FUE7_9GAST|nr:hypothetical protein ElyMa_000490600 [Elysia marginata]